MHNRLNTSLFVNTKIRCFFYFSWLLVLIMGCASLPTDYERVYTKAFIRTESTVLGRFFSAALDKHPEQSGFLLLNTGKEAYISRLALAEVAEKSIDVQYYIWEGDRTSKILAQKLLQVADRGVRVRILIDDFYLGGKRDFTIATFDRHPNIEIRIFNPLGSRQWKIFRGLELVANVSRLKHRMHNKLFAVDNQVAIVGGRNIGDIYFGVDSTRNYRDLDVMTVGPIVTQISDSFDIYWNSKWAIPISAIKRNLPSLQETEDIYRKLHDFVGQQSDFPYKLPSNRQTVISKLDELQQNFIWAAADVIYDAPQKVTGDFSQNIAMELKRVLENTDQEILVVSPYLIPVSTKLEGLTALEQKGVRIQILMNSLASTDVMVAHVGYARHRRQMLQTGAQLFELRPDAATRSIYTANPEIPHRLSLHAKAAVFDQRVVYIGSYNIDRLGAKVITEIGLIIHSSELATQVLKTFAVDLQPENAWQVLLEESANSGSRQLVWIGRNNGKEVRYSKEPEVGFGRGFGYFFLSLLPIY